MVISFACAIGVDIKFNTTHHETAAVKVHTHANGKKHEHHNKVYQHHEKKKGNEEKKGCCNDAVVKIYQFEKTVPQSNIVVTPIIYSAFIASYFNIDIFSISQIAGNAKYFLQNYHPPITDIRIAIQSFQI